MASLKPDPFLLREWDGCLWRGFEREPQPRRTIRGRPQPSHGGNHGNLSKMRVRGPSLPLGKGKEKQQSAHQGLVRDLAPLPPWLKPNRWTGQKKNKVRTLVNCIFFPSLPLFPYPSFIFIFPFLFFSFLLLPLQKGEVFAKGPGGSGLGGKGSIFYGTFITRLDES